MKASCTGALSAHEAVIQIRGATTPVVADVTDPVHPRTICTLTGNFAPQLVTQSTIAWLARQNPDLQESQLAIGTLSLLTGASAVLASWQGASVLDGNFAWSPDQSSVAYVTSDANSVYLHHLSGGGDRVVAGLGPVPGRGGSPTEDDVFLGFSPDSRYFAFVQTVTSTGDHLQIRRTADGGLAYSQAEGTMATWGTSGSKLYFRQPDSTTVKVWDPASGVSTAFAQPAAWIRPSVDAGDDYLAYTVRDASGIPHVWLYGHAGQAGGELPNVRSEPVFMNADTIFMLEEAPCGDLCGPGPSTQPDGKTFTYSIASQAETVSTISAVYATWPRPGQR